MSNETRDKHSAVFAAGEQKMSKANDWLKRHFNFGVYSKAAPKVDFFSSQLFLVRYYFFTKTRKGASLRGTIGPDLPRALRVLLSALPFLLVLSAVVYLPMRFESLAFHDSSGEVAAVAAGFLTATLAVAGIFLTLFYTNAASVYSSKYPNGNDTLSRLFVELLSSDRDLRYCGAFVITVSAAFVALGLGWLNTLVIAYVFVLLVALVAKLPGVLRLLTEKASFTAISAKPAERLLALAYASSYKRAFHESLVLTLNFKKFARSSIESLNELMKYALTMENRGEAYSKMLGNVLLNVLIMYSSIAPSIPVGSRWYLEESTHNSWFMSSFYEVSLAIDTGTIPYAKSTPDPQGYQKEVFAICLHYQARLMEQRDIDGLIEWCIAVDQMFDSCLANGDVAWVRESAPGYLGQLRSFIESLQNTEDVSQLRKSCQLVEVYSMTFTSIILGLLKICMEADPHSFLFESFDSFKQKELQSKGFPLFDSSEIAELCKKISYELWINECVRTPSWYFNKEVCRAGNHAITSLSDFVSNLYSEYLDTTRALMRSNSDMCYIPVLREPELRQKAEYCFAYMDKFSKEAFGGEGICADCIARVKDEHDEFIRLLPQVVFTFADKSERLRGLLPDIPGFACFNYCQLLYEGIIDGKLEIFVESIKPLYAMVAMTTTELINELEQEKYNEIYKSQVMSEPTLLVFELAGMAYCMAELLELTHIQALIVQKFDEILSKNPSEAERWKACLNLAQDTWLNRKISIDVDGWRFGFHDAVSKRGLYPESLRNPFRSNRHKFGAREERIKKMISPPSFNHGRFNGCAIFRDYVLEGCISVAQEKE